MPAKSLNKSLLTFQNGKGLKKRGNQILQAKPVMLMKTKETGKRCAANPAMCMITSNL